MGELEEKEETIFRISQEKREYADKFDQLEMHHN
jgi:hypothetical protein